MVDLYLLTAPILLLAIVILLRFVGCTFTPGIAAVNITLTAQACNGKVTLSWIDSGGDTGSSYQIYRDGSPLQTVMQMTSYLDTTVANGTTYSYTVSGSFSGSVYATSNTASATPGNFPCRPSEQFSI